ncbi:MAG: SDR family oxidoreductase [Rhodopirellula sp.]|nr:SDR family oxidoreductase [Rhodopirellula sp.]
MERRSNGRVALVTGSGRRRVGNRIAGWLADRGYSIALHYHSSAEAAEECVEAMRSAGVDCEALKADVAQESDVEAMFAAVMKRFGRLDALVTTASIWETKLLEDVTADDVRRNFDVNALGTFLCARRAGLIMTRQPEGGAIVTIGDWAIERPYLDHSAYFLSKGAIPTLTRSLAVELAHRNPKVRVNCIHPGPVMFPSQASEEERREMVESTLVKQANCPESVCRAVDFFLENDFVTGVCLAVDGGRTIFAPESISRTRPI